MYIKYHNMKKGFTMIELIFVIVIIGVLAGVAIPKISANRDDAIASVCASALSTFITEITTKKATTTYTEFKKVTISDLTNLKLLENNATNANNYDYVLAKNNINNFIHNQTITTRPTFTNSAVAPMVNINAGVTFFCEGAPMVWIYTDKIGSKFPVVLRNIYTESQTEDTPASDKANIYINKQYDFNASNVYNIY